MTVSWEDFFITKLHVLHDPNNGESNLVCVEVPRKLEGPVFDKKLHDWQMEQLNILKLAAEKNPSINLYEEVKRVLNTKRL